MLYSPPPRTLFRVFRGFARFPLSRRRRETVRVLRMGRGLRRQHPFADQDPYPRQCSALSLSLSLSLSRADLPFAEPFHSFWLFFTTFPAVCSVFFPSPWTLIKDKLSFDRCRSSSRLASFFLISV